MPVAPSKGTCPHGQSRGPAVHFARSTRSGHVSQSRSRRMSRTSSATPRPCGIATSSSTRRPRVPARVYAPAIEIARSARRSTCCSGRGRCRSWTRSSPTVPQPLPELRDLALCAVLGTAPADHTYDAFSHTSSAGRVEAAEGHPDQAGALSETGPTTARSRPTSWASTRLGLAYVLLIGDAAQIPSPQRLRTRLLLAGRR